MDKDNTEDEENNSSTSSKEQALFDTEKNRLKPYFEEYLSPILKNKNLTDDTIKEINEDIVNANLAYSKNLVSKENAAKQTDQNKGIEGTLIKSFQKLIEEPIEIIKLFRSSEGLQPLFNFIISLVVVIALLILAGYELLEKSQTATLFGGIVGYLLGHTRR